MVLLAVAFLAIAVSIYNVSGAPNHHPHHDHHPHDHHHHHGEMREKVYQLMCGNEEFSRGVKTCLDGITNEKAKVVMGTCSMVKGHNETKSSEDLIKALCSDPKYAEEVHKCTALLFPLINCTSDPSEIHPHNDNCHLDDDDDDDDDDDHDHDHDHDDNDDDGDDSDDDSDDSDDDDNSDGDYDNDDHDHDEDRSDNKHRKKHHKHNHHHHHHHHAPHHHPGPYGHDFGANQECFNNLYEKFNLTSSTADDE